MWASVISQFYKHISHSIPLTLLLFMRLAAVNVKINFNYTQCLRNRAICKINFNLDFKKLPMKYKMPINIRHVELNRTLVVLVILLTLP